MRVLFVPDKPERYGAAISLKRMIFQLYGMGVEPVILAHRRGPLTKFAEENGYEYHIISFPAVYVGESKNKKKELIKKIFKPVLAVRSYLQDKKALVTVAREIDFSRIDIIHTNIDRNDFGALLAAKYNIPHVWHIREFGELDYNCIALRPNYISFMNEHTDRFIAISNAIKKHWIGKGLRSDKIVTVYNGVPEIYVKEKIDDNVLRIVFTGTVSEAKGQLFFLTALVNTLDRIHDVDYRVDFFGTGSKEDEEKIKSFIKNNNLDKHVTMNGYIEKINERISDYDIGVICSRAEGFGRVTAEYMMAGLCVIASDTGANPELIENGLNGFLYKYEDVSNLSACIEKVFTNKELRINIGKKAREKALSEFTEYINAANILKVYKELLK